MTLTRAELVQRLVECIGLNRREAEDMVDAFFDEIASALEAGNEVKLSGFGNFGLRTKSARTGRNPKTGEQAIICARRVVTFHPSEKLKLAVRASAGEDAPIPTSASTERRAKIAT